MADPNVVRFPSHGRASRGAVKSSDEKLASDIRSAWRRLWKVIGAARAAGLTVETNANRDIPPTIERRL